MPRTRIIPRLDIKSEKLIKGIHLEGLRVMGDPKEFATKYYEEGADELIYMDSVASLYGRNNLSDVVRYTAENIFVPLTVGGGIRSVEDATKLLSAGADKTAINTAAIKNPTLISDMANVLGSQCVVLSIEAKRIAPGKWEAYVDNGREKTGKDVMDWVKEASALGVGEILITSVDQEGTKKGYDSELVKQITAISDVPVIASGGMGSLSDMDPLLENEVSALSMASVLHYNLLSLDEIKQSVANHA